MPRLLLAYSASARQSAALDWLTARIDAHHEALLVGTHQRAVDDLLRGADLPQGGLLGAHRSSVGRLAADLAAAALAGAGRTRLSQLGAEALAARAVARVEAQTPLAYFSGISRTPGFARALAATLLELRLEAVAAADVAEIGRAGPDLARLLLAFADELDDQGLADAADVWAVATAAIADGAPRARRMPVALLDVAPRSAAEQAFLRALAEAAPDLLAVLPATDPEARAGLEAALSVAAEVIEEPAADTALARVRRWVFATETPPEGAADDSLAFFSAPGEARECVEIARRVRELAADGRAFDRVGVFLRSPDRYQPLLADALQRARIPAFFTRGARRPHPAGRALLALLACKAEGLSASRFAEYLSLGQVPRRGDDGGPAPRAVPWVPAQDDRQLVFSTPVEPPPAPEDGGGDLPAPLRWEQLLVDAAVIGGRDRWARRLEGLRRELELQIAALDREGGHRRRGRVRDLAALQTLERFALPVIAFLDDLPAQASWHRWLDALTELLGLAVRDTDPVVALLAELRPMGEVGPVGLDEVRLVLTERLSFLREEPSGDRFGRVFVGSLDEAAGRTFDVVFLPGLAEGEFPKKASEDPLLLDEARERLRVGLGLRRRRAHEERARLHAALGAAKDALRLSYPRMDVVHGRPRVPSFYALDVLRAAEGRVPDLAEMQARAAEAADARLGWPAPHDPARSVDVAEYDLAVLGPLVYGAPEQVRGRGRYLVEADQGDPATNACLVRALRHQAARWRTPWSRADGLVLAPDRPDPTLDAQDGLQILSEHRPSTRVYSASALQQYAACPYRFFLSAILHLRPREAPAPLEQMDPLTRGSLFHAAQFAFFEAARDADLFPVVDDNLDDALEVLSSALERVARRFADDLHPAIPQVWAREVDVIRTDLRRWLREVAAEGGAWRPVHAELAFGLKRPGDDHDPRSVTAPITILERYRVRGSIDLVETRADGVARITDHKSGRAPGAHPVYVGGGEHLQPLLYGLAARALLDTEVASGRLYFCTHRGGYEVVEIPVDEPGEGRLRQVFETIEAAVDAGFLPAAPKRDGCRWCDFALVCGPQEPHRVQAKRADGLVSLEALRRQS